MAELFLVRHGQASFGADNYDKLSALGYQQAQWLGQYFKAHNIEFDSLLIGNMVRHEETAAGIVDGLEWETAVSRKFEELNEFDFHAITTAYLNQYPDEAPSKNAKSAEFYKILKKSMLLWSKGRLDGELPESWYGFSDRVQQMLSTIQTEFQGQKVLAVSSGGAIAMAVSQILKSPSETVIELNLQTKNTAITRCFFNKRTLRLHSFNHVPHLDNPQRIDKITYS